MTLTFDQIHFGVPDPMEAATWYRRYLGAKPGDHFDRVMFGDVRFIFLKNPTPMPTRGAAIDHAGLAFADLGATMRILADSGMRVIEPVHEISGMYRLAVIEDPWGSRIELIEDSRKTGLHHVQLSVPDPDVTLAWYLDMFGGQPGKLNGRFDGLKYGDMWILAEAGEAVPSAGHAIDHIGWRMPDLLASAAELRGKSLKFTSDPHPGPPAAHAPVLMCFVEDPWGVKIELLQRPVS